MAISMEDLDTYVRQQSADELAIVLLAESSVTLCRVSKRWPREQQDGAARAPGACLEGPDRAAFAAVPRQRAGAEALARAGVARRTDGARTAGGVEASLGRRSDAALGLRLPARRSAGDGCIDRRALAVELRQPGQPPGRWLRPIYAHRPALEGEFALHWAGDLDGDGRADLVLRYHDGIANLLLSAQPAMRIQSRPAFPLAGC